MTARHSLARSHVLNPISLGPPYLQVVEIAFAWPYGVYE
jgi:hypothetical protein